MTPEEKRLIGMSDASALLGLDKHRTAFDVYRRVVEGVDTPDTPVLQRGRRFESVIRTIAAEDFGLWLNGPVSLRDPKRDYVRGTLDDRNHVDGPVDEPVEFKSVSPWAAEELGESGTDHVKEGWLIQCQGYLRLTGAQRCHLVALVGLDDARHFVITADVELQGLVFEAIDKFYVDHVKPQRPPPIDGSTGCADWLASRFPRNDGRTTLLASKDAEAWAARYRTARMAREEAERVEAEARNQLVSIVGEADGIQGGGWRLSYAQVKGRAKTDWEAVAREASAPEALVQKHTTIGAGYRRFLLKEKS